MSNFVKSKNSNKKEISLMTLLANESTQDSRKLLRKYNQPDAVSFDDLESKLANLYFKTDDKIQLEKEMANIHPHKKWLIETLQPIVEIKKEEVKVEIKPEIKKEEPKKEEVIKVEQKSNFESCSTCNCPACTNAMQGFNGYNFAGKETDKTEQKDYLKQALPLVGVIAVIGIVFYALSKTTK